LRVAGIDPVAELMPRRRAALYELFFFEQMLSGDSANRMV